MKKSAVERIGFEADAFGTTISDGTDFNFMHGVGDCSKYIELDRHVSGGDAESWTNAMLKLKSKLQEYIDRIDELLEEK